MITIREYTNDDRQAYLVVYIVGYYHSLCRDWLFRYPLFTEVPQSDEICLIAYENEIPVGLVKTRESEDLIDINEIAVLPEYRQKGVAKALIKKLENEILPVVCLEDLNIHMSSQDIGIKNSNFWCGRRDLNPGSQAWKAYPISCD